MCLWSHAGINYSAHAVEKLRKLDIDQQVHIVGVGEWMPPATSAGKQRAGRGDRAGAGGVVGGGVHRWVWVQLLARACELTRSSKWHGSRAAAIAQQPNRTRGTQTSTLTSDARTGSASAGADACLSIRMH